MGQEMTIVIHDPNVEVKANRLNTGAIAVNIGRYPYPWVTIFMKEEALNDLVKNLLDAQLKIIGEPRHA